MDWMVVAQQVILIVLGVAGSAIATFGVILVKRIAAKYGVHLSHEELQLVSNVMHTACLTAERWAKVSQDKKTGSEKMDYAITVAKGLLGNALVKKVADEKLRQLAESILEHEKIAGPKK